MSVVDQRTTTTVRHEYLVPQPAAYGNVLEAIDFARRDAGAAGVKIEHDDAMHVTHNDDNIIVYWEEVTK
ncbi:hypothetical protein [Arthrobacter bambusae]|uniref:hypothetical protein n=1 Tax=Arthrobacter bambusae TaxID=1338426 RepID=UPI0027867B1F|nr:hypothetical protein [Arthrobacter bambusae]MDQ0241194.1 hypothetical protein [Arthrobacter bambusae]